MNNRLLLAIDRLSRCVFYPALVLIFLRPSWLKFSTPLGRVSITTAQSIVIFLCSLWLLAFLMHPRRYFTSGTIEYPLLLFLAANCASALLSPFGSPAERVDAIMEILLYAAFFYASLYLLRTAVDSRRVISVLFSVAVLVALVNVAYHYRQGMWKMIDRGYPFWDGKNALGLFMVLALSLSTVLLARPKAASGAQAHCSGWRTTAFVPGLFVIFLCAVYSYSRGAWIAMVGAALLFSLFRSWRLVALLVAAILVLQFLPHRRALNRFLSIGQMRDRNVAKRLVVWKNALRMIRARPLTGVGPGEFRTACSRFEDAADTRNVARAPQEKLTYRDHAHNLFLQVGAEAGVGGLCACVWGVVAVCGAIRARVRDERDPVRHRMAQGLAAALAAFLVFSLVDCSWTGRFSGGSFMHINFTVTLFLAMLYAMGAPHSKSQIPNPNSKSQIPNPNSNDQIPMTEYHMPNPAMMHSNVVAVRDSNGIRWQVSAAYAPIFLAPRTPDPRQLLRERTGELIKRSPMRIIFAASIPAGKKELPLIIKIYRRGRLGDWIKANVCGSKACREWRITTAASERGLPTVAPVAYGERRRFGILMESYLLTVRLFNCVTLEASLFSDDGTLRADARTRRQLIILLATLLRRMHDYGIYHQDLHPGNFLVETLPSGEKCIYLLDLHRASARPSLALKHRIKSLAQFNMFASISLSAGERLLFFNSYFGEDEPWKNEKRALLALIDARTRAMRWRLWKRREQRCRYSNKYFMRLRFAHLSGFARREEWKGEIAELLLARDMPRAGASLVKASRSKSMWEKEVTIQGAKRMLFIKHYRRKRGWQAFKYLWRCSQAIRSWQGAYALQIRNVNAVNAIAALEERRAMHLLGDAYLLTHKIPSVENLAAALVKLAHPSRAARQARRELIRSLALFFRRAHSRGVYHGDTKATNILVGKSRAGRRVLYLTDLDFVRTRLRLSRRNVLRNLVQLNSSLLDLSHAGIRDRLSFLKAYLGERRRPELTPMWKAIARRTRRNLKKRKRSFSRSTTPHAEGADD